MINLKTDNSFLLKEREKATKYLLEEILSLPPQKDIIDDLINMTEFHFGDMEINEKNISLVYSRIYSADLKSALPPHVLKETTSLKIVR